jgi:adenylate cyclase
MADIDFGAEGLLEGLEGRAREGRLKLLEELSAEGVPFDELKRAADEGRLALLPVERVLGGADRRYSPAEIAERAGIELDFLKRQWRAVGMAVLDDDEPGYGEQDLEAARRVQALRAAGVPDEGIVEVGRLLGMSMSQLAAANRRLIAEAFVREDDTEYEVAKRFEAAAEAFRPVIAETLPYVLNLHLLEQIRHDAVVGELTAATQEVTVAFADLVGFTRLGETLEPEQLGTVTGRLAELAAEAVEPPVRLVKMIGDAAMSSGPSRDRCSTRRSRWSSQRFRRARTSRCSGRGSPPARGFPGRATGTGGRSTSPAGSPASPTPPACSPPRRSTTLWPTTTGGPSPAGGA